MEEIRGEGELQLNSDDRKLLEKLMYGTGSVKRFTQDSPILPDVWMAFFAEPNEEIDLLLTPMRGTQVGKLALQVRERLKKERNGKPANVSYNTATVAARVTFRELIRVVLPLTKWWYDNVWETKDIRIEVLGDEKKRVALAEAIQDPERKANALHVNSDLLWLLRVVGAIAFRSTKGRKTGPDLEKPADPPKMVDALWKLVGGMITEEPAEGVFVWNVTRNRRAELTIYKSSLAVKADAAARVFDIKCDRLTWAIIDSGVDATHRAFQNDLENEGAKAGADDASRLKNSRVKATYDFTVIHDLLNLDSLESGQLPDHLQKALADPKKKERLDEALVQLKARLQRGQDIDWAVLDPLLRIDHDPKLYQKPVHDHGTHVAGILAADWPDGADEEGKPIYVKGICPDLRLYDMRVLDAKGEGDEFSIIAALQFIRYLNASRDYAVIHGANLSLSMRHDVSNYACGRTPVCDECDRVVAAGVVVVTAAGNLGYHRILTDGGLTEGYHTISITDPGNADTVITVGATHRYRPQTYGVSYFSSRGPTGDGRIKPDLVAPGEKIYGPLPGDIGGLKDGTSMATPHVSGAAALLMARYNELVGRPIRVKQILCETATDLGRERYFQGNGMLDILRALQKV